MRKLKFLFFALTAFACSNAWGIANGEYFIMNVGSGYFLGGANDWGTQASLVEHPQLFGINPSGETYTLDSFTYNNATEHYLTGTYVDGAATSFYFTEVGSGSGIYTISTAKGSGYLTAASSDALSVVENNGTSSSSTLAQWKFITKVELLDACKSATKANPVDMTGFIKAANFSRNHYNKNFSSEATWTVEGYNTTDAAANSNIAGGNNKNLCAESWRSSNGFNVHQTLTGLPNGTYKFRAQAAVTDYTGTGKDLPVVYCNDSTVTFNSMVNGEIALSELSDRFTNGEYYTDFVEVLVLDKTLTFGFKGSRSDTWNVWDNFQLYFVEPLDLSIVASALSEALSTANTLTSSAMQSTALAGLNSVITAYTGKEYDNEEDYKTAIAAVNAAITAAKASVAIYQQIALLNEKVKGYDTAGQAAYATTLAAYNNGTLTTYEAALAAYRTAVKAQTTAGSDMTDAIINPNFDGNINGWTDTYTTGNHGFQNNNSYANGTATINQFMECWVTDSGSLANGKLSQVISGLPEGEYTMSAAIISCRQNQPSLTLTGVYIFAQSDALFKSEACATGDGKPETVSFDFKMKGESLELGLMTDGTNCNWVAFDNVKLIYNGPLKGNIYQDQLNEALKNYSDRSDEHANGDVKSAYAAAYSAAVTAGETNGESDAYYQDVLSALETADAAMTASVDAYASLKAAFTPYVSNTAAATLVAEAQGIYEAAAMTPDEVNAYVLQFGLDIFIATNDSPFTGSAVGEGTFYLYNLKSRKFMNGGNDWGTRVSLADAGQPMELAASGTGYTINSLISNGGGSHFVGTTGYLDATETVLTFKKIADGIYTICWEDGGTKMYGYDGSTTLVATQTAESTGSYWQLVTAEEICAAAVANGTEAAPFDVSSLIKDNNFGRNNTLVSAWQGSPAKNGANDNMNAEKYNTTFDVYQTLTDLPNGKYIVKAQGFYRAGGQGTTNTAANAMLYANTDSVAIENINDEASATSGNGFTKQAGDKYVPNSQADASAVFSAGKYDNNVVEATVTDGTLKIGFKKDVAVDQDWTIFDNVRLYYCGAVEAKGTVKMTFVDYDNPDTAAGEVTEAVAGYNKISGGIVVDAEASWGVTKIIFLKVDISGVAITNGKVTLSAECSGSTDGKRVTVWGVGYNTSTWSESLTYNNCNRAVTLCGEVVSTTTSAKDTYETLSWDITDAFAGGNTVATILVYETKSMGGNFKNPTVTVEEAVSLEDLVDDLEELMATVPDEMTMEKSIRQALIDAITIAQVYIANYNADPTSVTAEKIEAAYDALEVAIDNAKASIEIYKGIKEAMDENIAALDEAGQKKFNELTADVMAAYNDGKITDGAAELAAISSAIIPATKAQTSKDSDWSILGSNKTADWTGATATYQTGVERYTGDNEAAPAGTILSQTIGGLIPFAKYEVQFYAAANVARNLSDENKGDGIAYVFANDTKEDITVGSLSAGSFTTEDYLHTLTATVGADGTIEFGLGNNKTGGQWYVAQFVSLKLIDAPLGLSKLIIDGVAGKAAGETLTIELTEGEEYPLSCPSEAGLVNLVINGNGAIVNVSAGAQITGMQGIEINDVNFNCAEATVAPVALSATPDESLHADKGNIYNNTQNAYINTCTIAFNGCNFAQLPTSLFSNNGAGWVLGGFIVNECVVQFCKSNTDPYINFEKATNNVGAIKNFTINASTLFNDSIDDAYFIRFANSSNGQASKAFPADPYEYITFTNNTFVNICTKKNFGNNTMNNAAFVDEVKGNVFFNVYRLNKYFQANNTYNFTAADNAINGDIVTIDGTDKSKIATEDNLLLLTLPEGALDFDGIDALKANFTAPEGSYAAEMGFGDPRWIPAPAITEPRTWKFDNMPTDWADDWTGIVNAANEYNGYWGTANMGRYIYALALNDEQLTFDGTTVIPAFEGLFFTDASVNGLLVCPASGSAYRCAELQGGLTIRIPQVAAGDTIKLVLCNNGSVNLEGGMTFTNALDVDGNEVTSITTPKNTYTEFVFLAAASGDFTFAVARKGVRLQTIRVIPASPVTAYPVTIKSGLVTFCAPTAATIATGLTAWYAASFNDTYVQMEQLDGDVIPANMGVVLAGENGDYVLPVSTSSASAVDNLLIGVNTKTMLNPTTDGNTNYVLVSGEFCPFTGTATVPAGKAYLSVPAAVGTLGLRFGDATVIENASVETTGGVKVNTLGQAVGDDYKGIVIMNGKKYMMK